MNNSIQDNEEYSGYYIDQMMNILNEASNSLNFAKSPKRKSRTITDKDEISRIVSIDHLEASKKSTIMNLFADFGDGPQYNPYDIITIPPHSFGGLSKSSNIKIRNEAQLSSTKTNSSSFTTTIGLWIFNRSFIEPMSDILGYINVPVTKDVYGDLNQKVSYALLEDKITVDQLKNFIIQSQILMGCCSALSPSHTEAMFAMEEPIAKRKAELTKKYQKELDNGNLVVMKKMENELIDYAKDILKDDPALDMYDSGARSTYDNNFKNMYIMRSGVTGTTGDVKIVTSSYIEGMDKKDFVAINDSSTMGPYRRSKLTSNGGYTERLLMNSTSVLKVLPKGSDCGTKDYIEVSLDKKNIKDWYYSFIIENNGSLTELTPEVSNKYIGKIVKMRFSSLCKAKNGCICEKCAGTLFNRIGIQNIGIVTSILGSSLKNKQMKSFHDSVIELSNVDPREAFSL